MAEKPTRSARKMGRAEIERHLADLRPGEDPEAIKAGIRPDRRPWYARGNAKAGVPVHEALYHFFDKAKAKQFLELYLWGHAKPYIRPPGWSEEKHLAYLDDHFKWNNTKNELEYALLKSLRSGELQARGISSSAPLDSGRVLIAPERWLDLELDIMDSSAEGPGVFVTKILITKPSTVPPRNRATARESPGTLRRWYIQRVADMVRKGIFSTRDEDFDAAKARFGDKVVRDAVRGLRRELAPASWTGRGRKKGSRHRKGRDDSDA